VQAAGAEQHIRGTHPSGLELIVDAEPDPAHQAVVWQLGLTQSERGSSPRLHDLQLLDVALDGALAPDPVVHAWLGGAM
jgi:hypothetical protein